MKRKFIKTFSQILSIISICSFFLTSCSNVASTNLTTTGITTAETLANTISQVVNELSDEEIKEKFLKNNSDLLMIKEQGVFSSGGTVTDPIDGEYDYTKNWQDTERKGTTAHVDHANTFYQVPLNDTKLPMVFLHGYGQSRVGWQTTPDGREGWADIFLKMGHSIFLVDQPRRGEAGSTTTMTKDGFLDAWGTDSKDYKPGDQSWYTHFRIGKVAPDRYEGSKFPEGDAAQNQFFRQMTPNTGTFDLDVNKKALSEVLNDVYKKTKKKSIYVTHSQGCTVGFSTDFSNVAALIFIEPGAAPEVGSDEYNNILKANVPVVFYYGDYLGDRGPEEIDSTKFWKNSLDSARTFAESFNKDGGDATVIYLPEIGITGNSHFMFQETNNKEIADHIENWLNTKLSNVREKSFANDNRNDLVFPLGNKVEGDGYFKGETYINPIINKDDEHNISQTNVITFAPSARNVKTHAHGKMYILGTGGVGYYKEKGKDAIIIRKGDVVECIEGVEHWHGATKDSWFQQIVIYDANYTTDFQGELITDEEYDALK